MTTYLDKLIEIPSMIIVIRSVFHENNKYYPRVFLMNVYINHKKHKKYKNGVF